MGVVNRRTASAVVCTIQWALVCMRLQQAPARRCMSGNSGYLDAACYQAFLADRVSQRAGMGDAS